MEPPKPKRILVVDDEEDLTHFLTLLLARRTGNEVNQAHSGPAALKLLKEAPYHLMVTDIHMPQMSGLTLLREAKALNPDMEVILLTGQASLDSAVDALQMQAYDYIEKPVNADRLVQTVRNALAQQALAAELSQTIQQIATLNRDLKRQVREQIAVQMPLERIATAGVVLDHLERALGPSVARSPEFLKLRAGLERRRGARTRLDLGVLARAQAQEFGAVHPWIEVKLDLRELPMEVDADPGALSHAIRIVLENAVEAMQGRGVVHVSAQAGDSEARIRVRDEGPGFTEQALQSLEEPLAGSGSGTGLGLLIVRHIAVQNGGSLELGNNPAGGAEVTLRMPLGHA